MAKVLEKKEDLGYLGEDFQIELVKCFIEDQQFFIGLEPIINQNMFSVAHLRRIVGFMKDRYALNETVASYKDLDTLIRSKVSNAVEKEQCLAMLDKISNITTRGIDLIEGYSEKFFKQQNLIKAIKEAQDIIQEGNNERYYDIEDIFKKALECNNKTELGYHIFDNMEDALKEDYRCAIPTGADKLDEALYGGLAKGELGIIIAPSSVGKAQPLTSRILTPSGYKLMGDINVGDKVIGGDGQAHEVIGTFPQGKRPVYRVDFSNGCSCECDINHLWNVNTYYQRTRKTYVRGSGAKHPKRAYNPDHSYKTMSLDEIIKRGIIKHFDSNSKNDTYVFQIPQVKPVEFEYQEVPVDPYLIGYYIGDGSYARGSITVGKQDKEAAFNILSPILGDDLHVSYRPKRNIWSFNITGDSRARCNKLLGITAKSQDKVIPEIYLWNSKEVRLSLIQGLMDSDGSTDKKNHTEFTTKSKKLAEQVQFLFRSFGCIATISEKHTSYYSQKYNKMIDCGIAYRVYVTSIDSDFEPYRFERKLNCLKNKTRESRVCITNIEYLREDETKCILVDSDEHLYVTEDFIVTHNTSATTGFAANAAVTKTEENNYKGYKVLHIHFEDEDVNIKRKYYAFLTDFDACTLSQPEIRPIVVQMINQNEWKQMIQDNVIAFHPQSGEFSASDLKAKIKQLIARGFKPDMVVVDYFECLKLERGSSIEDKEYTREGITMRKLEAIAHEFNVALWCPVQGTKDSFNQQIVGMSQAGGSVKKVQIGHVIISFARTEAMRLEDKINIFINKFRPGRIKRNEFLGVTFNNGTTKFDFSTMTDDVDSALNNTQNYNTATAKQIRDSQRK